MQNPSAAATEQHKEALQDVLKTLRGRHVVGKWDTRTRTPQLGAVLILAAELRMLHQSAGVVAASLAFIGRGGQGNAPALPRAGGMAALVESLTSIARCFACRDEAEAATLAVGIDPAPVAFWPPANMGGPDHHESMEILQDMHELTGALPRIDFREQAMRRGRDLLDRLAPSGPRVAVHLKMTAPGVRGTSNADMPAWAEFFSLAQRQATFVLVGEDPVPDSIRRLGNVVVARELGATAVDQLCCVRLCDMFMGMASGPCQIAIFGPKPYAIFKNPEHHAPEMRRQMRRAHGFSFSLPTQLLLRESESAALLSSVFERLAGRPQ
jgi:hypothetical protein